ncbi:hypothetical protein G6L37_11820 [Agrobacterium rubi]|uniref:KAP family P-loop NTPase fold protein n=1 Tax=Agrobacterium rubi TaxID=28099 RepID=UPI0015723EC3|nr:P-loop NTPase fold protein [Agrobacterium rubi]NTF06849.1 hypothetical protein [Agrobacterium rubi]NTF19091.1 hypothetical protein [Agrobacterium rubi]NTF26054.1 hypothetical protein [Agrobacterium rubi]
MNDILDELDKVWQDDQLNRREHAIYLYKLVTGRMKRNASEGSFVVNIDARWGQGKTYFIRKMYEDVIARGHPAVFIDAWKYDYIDDPYTHVIAEIDAYFQTLIERSNKKKSLGDKIKVHTEAVRRQAGKIIWTGFKGGAKRASRLVMAEAGEQIIEMIETYSPETVQDVTKDTVDGVTSQLIEVNDKIIDAFIQKRLDDFTETKESLKNFQESLSAILELLKASDTKKIPMFIFVDELDRCRPPYAIAMLERIKHLFDVRNVAFVVATDTLSLSHSIKAVYGADFDSRQYLGRFFQRTFKLPEATTENVALSYVLQQELSIKRWLLPMGPIGDLNLLSNFIAGTSQLFGLSVRELHISLRMLSDITDAADDRYPLELVYLYALICEYVKVGELSRDSISEFRAKILKFGTRWVYSNQYGDNELASVVTKIWEIDTLSIDAALSSLVDQIRGTGGFNAAYLKNVLSAQYTAIDKSERAHPTQFATYIDMIKHAQRSHFSLLEDDEEPTHEELLAAAGIDQFK